MPWIIQIMDDEIISATNQHTMSGIERHIADDSPVHRESDWHQNELKAKERREAVQTMSYIPKYKIPAGAFSFEKRA